MRAIIVIVLAFVFYGFGRYAQASLNTSAFMTAVTLVACGILLQIVYAWLVNLSLNASGMLHWDRVRLRNDAGIVPIWISAVGFCARALLLAGTLLPILHAIGWFR